MARCIDCVNFEGSDGTYQFICKTGWKFEHVSAHDDGPCIDFLPNPQPQPEIRIFSTGATRDTDESKPDYDGFLSPLVIKRFGEYMNKHRVQADGQLRASDNWQKGIPFDAYMKSGWRHFMDWWLEHRGYKSREGIEDALCGLLFNVSGYLHEILKAK